ncbi:MAG: hypothetical protein LBH85_00190 [Treponema sp.]|jgi:integrase|nr:hypothetical protein [Treponema sp.]
MDLYRRIYHGYLERDPLTSRHVVDVEKRGALECVGRVGIGGKSGARGGGGIAGTRIYEIVVKFLRVAFKEYGRARAGWRDPFSDIDPPKTRERQARDSLSKREVSRLFERGAIDDPLERGICGDMPPPPPAGLRRSEIFALTPEDLDWDAPLVKVRRARKT